MHDSALAWGGVGGGGVRWGRWMRCKVGRTGVYEVVRVEGVGMFEVRPVGARGVWEWYSMIRSNGNSNSIGHWAMGNGDWAMAAGGLSSA